MNDVNMIRQTRENNVVVLDDHKIDGKGEDLILIGDPSRPKEAIVMGLGKARKLLQPLMNDPEAFIDLLYGYVAKREGKIVAARTPVKTLNYGDATYGLFEDGVIKRLQHREGKDLWCKVRGQMAEILTAESFDNPESLNVPVKVVKTARASSSTAVDELKDQLAQERAANAEFRAMMMQFMQGQVAGK